MAVCVAVKPAPTTITGEHWVACHWAAEGLATEQARGPS
jgi:hypothetical protein